jgi:ornithine cyclodeaminase
MIIVPESAIADLVTPEDSFTAVEAVFAAMARGEARNFPVVREALPGAEEALYGFKGGVDAVGGALGLKAGGYWPHNLERRGLINHQSTVFLFDPDTGKPAAMIGGNLLTALRTAAASAVSIAHLARGDAKVLGMIGAGHQSVFQMRAAVRQRAFEKVVGWNYHPEMLSRLADCAAELGLPFEAVSLEDLGAQADVIVTITSSQAPSLMDAHVRPGTHLACMGTDTRGKQEVEAALLARATVFTDEVAQSISIGEAQHAVGQGLISERDVHQLGAVIGGTHPGRTRDDEITLFDGTGVGLQDLAVAAAVVERAVAAGVALKVEI